MSSHTPAIKCASGGHSAGLLRAVLWPCAGKDSEVAPGLQSGCPGQLMTLTKHCQGEVRPGLHACQTTGILHMKDRNPRVPPPGPGLLPVHLCGQTADSCRERASQDAGTHRAGQFAGVSKPAGGAGAGAVCGAAGCPVGTGAALVTVHAPRPAGTRQGAVQALPP